MAEKNNSSALDDSLNSSVEEEKHEKLHLRPSTLPKDKAQLCRQTSWLEHFYEVLWACSLNMKSIKVPFTVCFQYQRPYAAYHSGDAGELNKIESKHIDTGPMPDENNKVAARMVNVMERYRTSTPGSIDRAASHHQALNADHLNHHLRRFLPPGSKLDDDTCVAQYIFSRDHLGKGDKDLGVEYLNAKELKNFLLFRQKVHNGVLQAWVNQGTAKVMSP
jgi:hypothetical protein